jgi:hypothetical protein
MWTIYSYGFWAKRTNHRYYLFKLNFSNKVIRAKINGPLSDLFYLHVTFTSCLLEISSFISDNRRCLIKFDIVNKEKLPKCILGPSASWTRFEQRVGANFCLLMLMLCRIGIFYSKIKQKCLCWHNDVSSVIYTYYQATITN